MRQRLRRAVDRDGIVLDVPVRSRRDKAAAGRLPRKPPERRCRPPRVPVADGPASYEAAKDETMSSVERRGHEGTGNRAGDSRRPTWRRERRMKPFESARHARRSLSAHDRIGTLFRRPQRNWSAARTRTPWTWTEITGVAVAA